MINFLHIKKRFPEYYASKSLWAYQYCKNIKDSPEMRKLITNSWYAYYYCRHVKDRPEVRKHITHPIQALWYCKEIQDRSEVAKHITDSHHLKLYHDWKNRQ